MELVRIDATEERALITQVLTGLGGRIGEYLRGLRATPPAPGSRGVMIPGDRARRERRNRLCAGIPLPVALWRELNALRDSVDDEASGNA
jgi:LDH2 family malate/lactate/ureidoglycolate dehydrogenase